MGRLAVEQLQQYARDGVIHVPGALDQRWIAPVLAAVERVIEPGKSFGLTVRPWAYDEEFRRFAFDAGLAELAAEATGSEAIRLYFDQIFMKKGNTDMVFAWHQDHPYWPIGGTQIASTWVALTAATADSSALEFVRGSHDWDTTFRPPGSRDDLNRLFPGFGDLAATIPDETIDFENHPDEYDLVSFDVEPGDALLFDYRILHRSRGNPFPDPRVAVSWRWLGDDATWQWEHGKEPVVDQSMTTLQPGDLITDNDT
ncbi:MAG: phytanoyl-CoA dioxygenase family protein, partial [Ilumatobacter sp.]